MARPKRHLDELIARGVRIALESDRPIARIAADLGIGAETLRKRVRQAEADSGARPELLSSSEREEIRRLRKENYELRRARTRSSSLSEKRSPGSPWFADTGVFPHFGLPRTLPNP